MLFHPRWQTVRVPAASGLLETNSCTILPSGDQCILVYCRDSRRAVCKVKAVTTRLTESSAHERRHSGDGEVVMSLELLAEVQVIYEHSLKLIIDSGFP